MEATAAAERREALSSNGGGLGAVPSELRAVLIQRCPQMADGVIEDEDALRNVLRAWTVAASDGCIATNATRCALLATDSVMRRPSLDRPRGADMLLAVRRPLVPVEAAGLGVQVCVHGMR